MPELFRMFGLRFFFFSNDHLPIHVHVKNSDGEAKFEVNPVRLIESAEALVEERKEEIITKWNEFFKP